MPRNPPRRAVLQTLLATGTLTIAGCSGTTTSSRADCRTELVSEGDGELLQEAAVEPNDDRATLRVVFLEDAATDADADRLVVHRDDEQVFDRSVDDQREHDFAIGERPTDGQFRITVETADGVATDELVVEFECTDE